MPLPPVPIFFFLRPPERPPLAGWWWVVPLLLLNPMAGYAQPDGVVHEYLTRQEALLEVFPSSSMYVTEAIRLNEVDLMQAEEALYRKLDASEFEVVLCYDEDHRFLGYAVISNELGKYRPITYIVGIEPDFKVKEVAVMVYREDRGSEVRMPRFLYQYKGKSVDDPIRTKRDIINISGATISVRSINAGVKKALYLVADHYRSDPPAAELPLPDVSPQQAEQ